MTSKPKATAKNRKISARKRDNNRTFYLASLIDNLSDALISTDMEFSILEWNTAAESMYGWTAAEVIGHPSGQIIQSEFINTTREDVAKAVLEEGIWKGEVTQRRKDGTRFPVMASVSLVKDETGKPIGFVAINRDITERKQAEEKIESLAKFPDENINPVLRFGGDGELLYANHASNSLLTMWDCETGGRAPEDLQRMISESLTTAQSQKMEIDCKGVIYSLIFVPIVDKHYVNVYGYDITERIQAEEKIAYQSHLLENVNDAVLATDAQFNLTSWNHAAEEMYGYKADEVLGHKAYEIIRSEFSDAQRAAAVQALIESGSYRIEVLQYHQDGHSFWVEGSTFAIKEGNEEIYGYISINRNITERKRAEEQVRRQLKHLNALRMIDIAISSSFDLDVILDVVLQQVLSQLGVDASALLLFNAHLQTIAYAASHGFRSDALQHNPLKLGKDMRAGR